MRVFSAYLITAFLIVLLLFKVDSVLAWPKGDLESLAANIYFEARGEPLVGQVLVAQVTLNRVKHTKWPDSIEAVVKQNKQFSWYTPWRTPKPKDKIAWQKALKLAKMFLDNRNVLDLSEGALYYHADWIQPKWAKHREYITTVGSHRFYR